MSHLSIITDQTQGGALYFFIVDLGVQGNTDSLILFTSYFSKTHEPHRWRIFGCSQIAFFKLVIYNRTHRVERSFFYVEVGRSGRYGNLGPLRKFLFAKLTNLSVRFIYTHNSVYKCRLGMPILSPWFSSIFIMGPPLAGG